MLNGKGEYEHIEMLSDTSKDSMMACLHMIRLVDNGLKVEGKMAQVSFIGDLRRVRLDKCLLI